MPTKNRIKTKYPGVFYIEGKGVRGAERIYYIAYRRKGKLIEEKAGRQFQDDMTPAKAAKIRARRVEGEEPSNAERRDAARLEAEAAEGRWTIARLWNLYREHTPDLRSRAADESRYKKYLEPSFGDKEPAEIVPLDIDRLRRRHLDKKSAQTAKHVIALLRRIVRFGDRKQLCGKLSFPLEMPAVDNQVTENLDAEQLSRLLKAIEESDDTQASAIMLMALYTGARKREILNLKWNDVDLVRGFIHIRNPKGGKTQILPLSQPARQVLETHPHLSPEHVFVGRSGKPFVEIRRRIAKITRKADLPKGFRPLHGLRHFFASALASSGKVDLYVLQRLLTHKSPLMTQRYAHLRDESLRKASDLMSSLVEQAVANAKKDEPDAKDG